MSFGKQIVTLAIADDSDGTGIAPPASKGLTRNDAHFLDKIAERWAKEEGRTQSGVIYRLERLPTGYGGYEKGREGSKHVDRFFYGHPNGHFRSINELWPHFRQLQEMGGTVGCECVLCAGKKKKAPSTNSNSIASSSPAGRSRYFPAKAPAAAPKAFKPSLSQSRLNSDSPAEQRQKQVDDEGTPDLYRQFLDELKSKREANEVINVDIRDKLSPDWRAGHEMLQSVLTEWQHLPGYVPRIGEVVLFARNVTEERIIWDAAERVYRRISSSAESDAPKWEAGVVTQVPLDSVDVDDLNYIPQGKRNVTYSGFRVEPLQPSADTRSMTLSHKYVPIHAMRPFCFLKECLPDTEVTDLHPSIRHAITVANSFCLVGRYAFKGAWPEATVFTRAIYLGAESIMVGDAVRILPPSADATAVTDIMIITSIRLRFVNLEEAGDDDLDNEQPYNTALHVAGKAFTLDPKRSFGGIAKSPVIPGEHGLPKSLAAYGQFFHVLDPAEEKQRLELPFQRILGRCFEDVATKAWSAGSGDKPSNSSPPRVDISSGLAAMQKARAYSMKNDPRIEQAAGKSWFWAETRFEQLDLHEVNGKFVGVKDESRSKKQMHAWRQALKVLDGKRGGLEEYHAARKQREEEEKQESAQAASSSWGLMAANANVDSATDAEKEVDEGAQEAEEIDEEAQDEEPQETEGVVEVDTESIAMPNTSTGVVIDLADDDDDDNDIMEL